MTSPMTALSSKCLAQVLGSRPRFFFHESHISSRELFSFFHSEYCRVLLAALETLPGSSRPHARVMQKQFALKCEKSLSHLCWTEINKAAGTLRRLAHGPLQASKGADLTASGPRCGPLLLPGPNSSLRCVVGV